MLFGSALFTDGILSSFLPGAGMLEPPMGGVGDAIGAGWEIGGAEPREGNGDGETTGAGVGPADSAGGGVTEGAGV